MKTQNKLERLSQESLSSLIQHLQLRLGGEHLKYASIYCLYYKHMMIVNDAFSVVSKWSSKLIDDARVVIYDRNMFIIQATDGQKYVPR